MDNRNLIQFPVDRVKRKPALAGGAQLQAMLQDPRKSGSLLSILSILVLAVYLNPTVRTQLVASNDRMPNAFGDIIRDAELERKLEQEFLRSSRFPASIGREPSTEDRLRVGDLHGRYRLVYRDEYVSEIALIVDSGADYEPVVLSDRKEFLEKYKSIIHPSFDMVEPDASATGSLRDETFKLKKAGQVVGLAHIKLDKYGRFYSMKVE